MKKLIILFTFITTLGFSQKGSLNIVTSFNGKPLAGILGVLEYRNFIFATSVQTNGKDLIGTIKASPVIGTDGRSRFTLGPTLESDIRTNKFKVFGTPEWNWINDKWTISIAANCRIVKGKSFVINETNNIVKNTLYPSIIPSISVQYLMYGNRWKGKKAKREKGDEKPNLSMLKCWNWADAVSLGLSIVDGMTRGALDAFYADPYVFEKRGWDNIYWRHNGWENKYVNNRYQNEDGSINPKKGELLGNAQYDFKHGADDVTKWSGRLMGASMALSTFIGALPHIKIVKKKVIITNKKLFWKSILVSTLKNGTIWFASSRLENWTYSKLRYDY